MRTIRFRIYNEILKRMLTDDEAKVGFAFMDGGLYSAANCTIMESTGLEDRSGKEIFEGDILQEKGDTDKWVVKWGTFWTYEDQTIGWFLKRREGKFMGLNQSHVEDREVIGDIYSNPELLQ